jgi:hypothetical protein
LQCEPLSGSETERVLHCSVEPLDRGVLRAAAEGERRRRLLSGGGRRSRCTSGPSFALRALGRHGLPVSNWASHSLPARSPPLHGGHQRDSCPSCGSGVRSSPRLTWPRIAWNAQFERSSPRMTTQPRPGGPLAPPRYRPSRLARRCNRGELTLPDPPLGRRGPVDRFRVSLGGSDDETTVADPIPVTSTRHGSTALGRRGQRGNLVLVILLGRVASLGQDGRLGPPVIAPCRFDASTEQHRGVPCASQVHPPRRLAEGAFAPRLLGYSVPTPRPRAGWRHSAQRLPTA